MSVSIRSCAVSCRVMPVGAVRWLQRTQDGELLTKAEAAGFDVLLTVDRGFEYEQNLSARKIAIVIFSTKSIRLKDLLPHIPAFLPKLESIRPGQVFRIGR